jgi:predicted nucleic acid-binding protein
VSLIYWDTMLFVYWLEADPTFGMRTKEIWDKMLERGDTLCTSIFTVGEVLTGFYKRSDRERAAEAREMFELPDIQLLPLTIEVTERYAQIRAAQRLTPADAIHLATASVANANLFLTNDAAISKLTVPGIDFVAGLNVNLF